MESQFHHLQNQIAQCRSCRDLFGFEPRPILFGNQNAKIMQIGQAPSKSVHEIGMPFSDASGKRLRGEWYGIPDKVFYNPDYFYMASMAHCFPGKALGGGDRRPPKNCSNQWLLQEVEFVNNEIYILIGGMAAGFFFPGQKLASLAFEDKQINGKPAYILPHPSPLNMKWFKDYPRFTEKRIFEIQRVIHEVLGI